MDDIAQLTRILQLSITPVALISGVGLLLLSMTNRLGRVIDRSREVGRELSSAPHESAVAELKVLMQRAKLLLFAIASIATSIFLAVLMVVALFAMYSFGTSLSALILALFAVCLGGLVVSISCFLGDILLSIRWLHLSLDRYVRTS